MARMLPLTSHMPLWGLVGQQPLNQKQQLGRGHAHQCWDPTLWHNLKGMSSNRVQPRADWLRHQ